MPTKKTTKDTSKKEILKALRSFKRGDFSYRMPDDLTGEDGEIAQVFNDIITLNDNICKEFDSIGKSVGLEGKLKQRAAMFSSSGSWKTIIDTFNGVISNLTIPMNEVSRVIGAVARGDLTQMMDTEIEGIPIKGMFLKTAKEINSMVTVLTNFSSEVTRVAREVGTEGQLGGQARVEGVSGTWQELTNSVNLMANNLTDQVRNIAEVATAVANGDLTQKIKVEARGEILELRNTINTMVDQLGSFASEVTRVAREVGTEGQLGGQAKVEGVSGTWQELTNSVNQMGNNLTDQVRNIAEVTTAVANGDLTQRITVEAQGEILELRNTINTMVGQLDSFAKEVTRVAREVGTEGQLGGQAKVEGVSGTWQELTSSVNQMANNLTDQVRNIAEVTTAVANGDLTQRITVEAQGEILELRNTINTMVDQLSSFAEEVTRVAREVGTEGQLGGQAKVEGVSGTWQELTYNVNLMASNLTDQVRNIAEVTTAVANGDLTQRITVEAQGEILELRNTINTMVDQLSSFAEEVTRVAREVGTEGQLGGQAKVEGVSGTWRELTNNVNLMANNLTEQVRNIAEVTTAVANGDLTQKITVEAQGEILELRNTINTMVDQLSSFSEQVTRVAREVGVDGKLGGQAQVEGISGTWRDLTNNVNMMANNLTDQVRNIAEVTTAVAKGDLSQKIKIEARGEILDLKNTINIMVDQLSSFASEVTRVAREVGNEGILGGQARVEDVSGTWRDLTNNVNTMATNLTNQVRNIAEVTTAVARGDLTRKITVEASGEILELRNTINTMVDQLSAFAAEVTRLARDVGTGGKLGGKADVEGVSGIWKDLTDNVNIMAENLTDQVRNIADVTTAIAKGDLTKKITIEARGEILNLKNIINTMIDQLSSFASEVTRMAREVGNEGKLGGQATVEGVTGTWKDLTDNVNIMANNLTEQVRNIASVTTAVANGDFSKKITIDPKGEILDLKNIINSMVDQLSSFASEVTRVAREVGTEGKLGGQADVKGVSGTWKDLTDNVNTMANNLTDQVRAIAKVVTAVATGDLKKKITLEAKGEIAELADTINNMIDTLATFADQVTWVAREVGVEGKLGGQANVPGAAGIWRELTDNVNELASNLTTQVRAIADVATAVAQGDLSQTITAEAMGEVAQLKDNINRMIQNLSETTRLNSEQDWLKTNLTRFTGLLQGQNDLLEVGRIILSELAPIINSQHGVFYLTEKHEEDVELKLIASYAFKERKHIANRVSPGDGLVGQCLLEKERILLSEVPHDYVQIKSGLGKSSPLNLVIIPVLFEDSVKAIIELASFNRFNEVQISFLDQLAESIGVIINSISATMRTEELLRESQSLAEELQNQQEELRKANEELEEQTQKLASQKDEVELKNKEVEQARLSIQEKAEQLSLTSKYKSEFLANMSHELRTPLNSLLILAKLLSENKEENLSDKQVEFADTIYTSGSELLSLINDILDLSKIEAGMMSIELSETGFIEIQNWAQKSFNEFAKEKNLDFFINLNRNLPETVNTDKKRLQQILKNLLSNAFKFTEKGSVQLDISSVTHGWSPDHDLLKNASKVIAFMVKDTGIGIPKNKRMLIFEAFQQADGSTSRMYGGTGLGLSISREIARFLGGEIVLYSTHGKGSTFTLFIPQNIGGKESQKSSQMQMVSKSYVPEIKSYVPEIKYNDQKSQSPAMHKLVVTDIEVPDDRNSIQADDKVVLIIEDDEKFAKIILDMANKKGFKGLIATKGETALALVQTYKPHAITLDIKLPDMEGWTILDRLKHQIETRHIPVHIISVEEDENQRGLKMGAIAFLSKPVTAEGLEKAFEKINEYIRKDVKKLLVVEDNKSQQKSIIELIGNGDVKTIAVETGKEALEVLKKEKIDCMVIDLGLPDVSGVELIEQINGDLGLNNLPIIVYTGKELSEKEETALRKVSETIIIKGADSMERLLNETSLFLHRVEENLPDHKQKLLKQFYQKDPALAGKKVLIIDDDVRNIFALNSLLGQQDMNVIYEECGAEGIAALKENPDIDIVLMDIMMPEMDGYETIRKIRAIDQFKNLPIIALTAKAMKGDREKCIQAGASDYIAKPIKSEQMFSLLRVWLFK
ncbi:sensor histidine kinase/response regulator [Candidatus Magnetomorum sp. HK-1]|nr:sensor histidine kinase/response regulator [Candidatus Magnetomorum sp. HK-1]